MKISMIMPIYNEEKLLPHHLELAAPHLDEIIIVDGGPYGPSTDGSQDIARKYSNVKVIKGTFELKNRKEGWDKSAQLQAGGDASSGDILIILSVDTIYNDYKLLSAKLKKLEGDIFYCHTTEFFIDTNHLRMTPRDGFPFPSIGYPIISRSKFASEEAAYFKNAEIQLSNFVLLHGIMKFHYGWITDFDRQVRKHIRNIKTGLWGEYGEQLLKGGDKAIETWAITHVLNYTKEIVFPYSDNGYHPLKNLEFLYHAEFDKVLMNFKKKHGEDYYDCI